MKKILATTLLMWVTSALSQDEQTQQVWTGRLSDSMCGASHQMKAAAGKMSERDCLFECIKALASYVLVVGARMQQREEAVGADGDDVALTGPASRECVATSSGEK